MFNKVYELGPQLSVYDLNIKSSKPLKTCGLRVTGVGYTEVTQNMKRVCESVWEK